MDRYFHVDAFTNSPFSGNPAGVAILDQFKSDNQMQKIAAEFNQPETSFLVKVGNIWHLRWFSPSVEVPLCGHATLAAAKILFEYGLAQPSEIISFETKSGILTARKCDDKIELNFPLIETFTVGKSDPSVLAYGQNEIIVDAARSKIATILELNSAMAVRNFSPASINWNHVPDLIITSKNGDIEYDIVSRFFAPSLGIPEDPVTGAAHCALAHFWEKRGLGSGLRAYQASKRGGSMETQIVDGRVLLRGRAQILFELNPTVILKA